MRNSWQRGRAGKTNFLTILLVLVLAAGGLWAYVFGRYYLDFYNMKEVIRSSALAWHANVSEQSGRVRLKQMLESKGIDYVTPEDCSFTAQGNVFTVGCSYTVWAYYPFTEYYKTLNFSFAAEVNERGVVTDY